MPRRPHPNPDVEAAICHAESHGWRIKVGGSHAWGRMFCPYNDDACRCGEFCIASIWSTPRNPASHGKQIRRVVDNCARERAKHEQDQPEQHDE